MSIDERLPEWRALQAASRSARRRAWAPYSNFFVGAAILTDAGVVVSGCNVENASYGLTICAERVAASSAVAQGLREFRAICVSLDGPPLPCGACRQFLVEFNPELLVLLDDASSPAGTEPELVLLTDLLPRPFRLEHGSR